jgi:hypothetical protein
VTPPPTLHIIDPTLEDGAVHVAVFREEDRDHAWILGPAEKVAGYRREILETVREVADDGPIGMTLEDALVLLAEDRVEGLEIPPIVRYSAAAILQEAYLTAGRRSPGVKIV